MTKYIEKWAAKFTQEGSALWWHQILRALGLPDRPQIEKGDTEANASLDFWGSPWKGDPQSILELNLNGMAARWKQVEQNDTKKNSNSSVSTLKTAIEIAWKKKHISKTNKQDKRARIITQEKWTRKYASKYASKYARRSQERWKYASRMCKQNVQAECSSRMFKQNVWAKCASNQRARNEQAEQ